jgi:hypothetical protein
MPTACDLPAHGHDLRPLRLSSADFLGLLRRATEDAGDAPEGFLYRDGAGAFWVPTDQGTPCSSFAEARSPEGYLVVPWGDLLGLRLQAFAEGVRAGQAMAAGLPVDLAPPRLQPSARPTDTGEPDSTSAPGHVRTYTARTHVGACGVATVDGEIRSFTATRPIADAGTYSIAAGEARQGSEGGWPAGSATSGKRVWRDIAGVHAGQPTTLATVLADLDVLAARARAAEVP